MDRLFSLLRQRVFDASWRKQESIMERSLLRAKKIRISLPVPVLITKLCRRDCVPIDAKRYIQVVPTTSINTQKIKVEYLKNQEKKKQKEAMETESMPAQTPLSTLARGPLIDLLRQLLLMTFQVLFLLQYQPDLLFLLLPMTHSIMHP